jgi:lipopolysaccharide export system permease protein
MRLDFLPSRTLTLYLGKLFIVRILAVLVMLVMILQMLDLLSQSGKILRYPGNGEAELWTYVSLRAPQLIQRFLPYSVLLATIITLATLNQNSEVVSMKAAGMSAHQVLAPLVLTAAVVAMLTFAFNERVVTRANATLNAWSAADFGPIPDDPAVRSNAFFEIDGDILTAQQLSGRGDAMVMNGVTYYRRNENAAIVEEVRAGRVTYASPGWRLENPQIFEVRSATTRAGEDIVVAAGLAPSQVDIGGVNGDAQTLLELSHSIDALEAAGRRTAELKAKWWHKFSGPLAAVLMPLLGAVAAFGLARSGHLFLRAVIGMSLGFAYFVVENAALAMGNFGGYPPFLAAWGPFLLFLLVGETVLVRTEE